MGYWGVDLYQNDTSSDVKEQFEEQLRKGKSAENATKELIEAYSCVSDDMYEQCAFWFALADTQWTWGVLQPEVKEQALNLLEKGGDIGKWQDLILQLQRKRVLFDLRINLMSPQPPMKKPIKRRVYRCQWKVGDVFAYRLESELAKEKGLYGRYFLIQKVDEGTWHPGHIVPIVYVKITEDDKIPTTVEEYNRLEYVQTSFTRYEDRFLPLDGRRLQEDIEEKSRINYEMDEYGYLPQFRIQLLTTSSKMIPSKLIYVSRFTNVEKPQKEFVPHSKLNISSVFWEQFGDTFDMDMIRRYCGHNLKEFSIYREENLHNNEKKAMSVTVDTLRNIKK